MVFNKYFLLLLLFIPLFSLGQKGDSTTVNKDRILKDTVIQTQVEVPKTEEIAAVTLKFDTLFFIKTSFNGASPAKRAKSTTKRLARITTLFDETKDSIYFHKGSDFIVVMYNEDLAFTVTKKDAKLNGVSLDSLANTYSRELTTCLLDHKYNLTSKEWMVRIGETFAALFGLILILWLIVWGFKKLEFRLSKFDKKLLKRRNNLFKYFIPKNTKNIFVFIASVVRFVLIVFFLLMYLPLLFSFLPWTQGLVEVFYGYIATPVHFVIYGFINFLPDLFFIVVIITVARYFARVLHDMAEDIEEERLVLKSFPKDWAYPTEKLFAIIIYAFATVMVFPHLPGSDSPAFKGVSIFLGVLFSLGSTSAIANIVAGIVITYMRPFQLGDRVQILDTVGDVVDKTLLVTRIRTLKNEDVTIPNATIINNHLINFSTNAKEIGLILHTIVSLGYDIPFDKVEKLLLRAARQSMLLQKDPKPFVLQKSLDDNYVTYELNAYTKQAKKMALIYSDLNKNIQDVFDKEGLEILSPKYVASRDGNTSTVPSQKGMDLRNPLEQVVDKLIGKNQKIKVEPAAEQKDKKETEKPKAVEQKNKKPADKKESTASKATDSKKTK